MKDFGRMWLYLGFEKCQTDRQTHRVASRNLTYFVALLSKLSSGEFDSNLVKSSEFSDGEKVGD